MPEVKSPEVPEVDFSEEADPSCRAARPDTQNWQKPSAAVQTIDPAAVPAKISGPIRAPGFESAGYRKKLKRKADAISR